MKHIYSISLITVFLLVASACKKENKVDRCLEQGRYYGGQTGEFKEGEVITVFIANSFTPNGDSINDTYRISVSSYYGTAIKSYSFKVFESSKLIFETNDTLGAWDGKTNGNISEGKYHFEATIVTDSSEVVYYNDFCAFINTNSIENCEWALLPDQIDPKYGFVVPSKEPDFCDD